MRQKYETEDGGTLELRPYMLCAEPELWKLEKVRRYRSFKKLLSMLLDKKEVYARGKIKELRGVLKEGEKATEYYLQSSLMDILNLDIFEDHKLEDQLRQIGTGSGLERRAFLDIDGKKHSLYFDAVEMLDTFIGLKEKGEQA